MSSRGKKKRAQFQDKQIAQLRKVEREAQSLTIADLKQMGGEWASRFGQRIEVTNELAAEPIGSIEGLREQAAENMSKGIPYDENIVFQRLMLRVSSREAAAAETALVVRMARSIAAGRVLRAMEAEADAAPAMKMLVRMVGNENYAWQAVTEERARRRALDPVEQLLDGEVELVDEE